jgi:hypothetical protein
MTTIADLMSWGTRAAASVAGLPCPLLTPTRLNSTCGPPTP